MNNTFTIDGIKCEKLLRSNGRTEPVPEGHYAIVADMTIDGIDYEWAEIYKDGVPFEESRTTFSTEVAKAKRRAEFRLAIKKPEYMNLTGEQKRDWHMKWAKQTV